MDSHFFRIVGKDNFPPNKYQGGENWIYNFLTENCCSFICFIELFHYWLHLNSQFCEHWILQNVCWGRLVCACQRGADDHEHVDWPLHPNSPERRPHLTQSWDNTQKWLEVPKESLQNYYWFVIKLSRLFAKSKKYM